MGRDLSISDLALSPAYPAPGDPVTLTAQVHNTVGARTLVTVSLNDMTALPADPLTWMIAGDPTEDLANAWPVQLRALPDLALSPHDILASGFGVLEIYERGPFTVTLQNLGPMTATNVTLSARSQALSGSLIYSETFSLVGPGQRVEGTFNHIVGDTATSIWFQLDPSNVITESNETNNLAIWSHGIAIPTDNFYVYLPLVMRN